ncbi:MAG: TspO/MBR family protein [Pseudomonadota bacterium]
MSWMIIGAFALANFTAASSGGIFKPGDWYESLTKPSWVPPNWAFPVVWAALFAMNTAAGVIVWDAMGDAAGSRNWMPFIIYGVSLAINAGWSAFFFGMKRMDLAFGDVVLLWLSLAAQIVVFAPISLLAAALTLPYLAWVTLAGALNIRMIQLNASPMKASG